MKKIYLAIAYKGHEEESFRVANRVASELLKEGCNVYSPISHSHPIATQCGLPTDWDFWKEIDTEMIAWSDEVKIITFRDWKKSTGVNNERSVARDCGIKISTISQHYRAKEK